MRLARVLVATHKQYEFPDDPLYAPIQVGVARGESDFGYLVDNKGDNISLKNESYCELTALYWAWKNGSIDEYKYIGLVHYRRYFAGDLKFGEAEILESEAIEEILLAHDIIVPKRRNYYIQSVYSHYSHAHYEEDLQKLREVIAELSPPYIHAFDAIMKQRSLHLYNMFVMPSRLFVQYCEWLFPILFALEERIDISKRNAYQKRVFGFLAERLFNVWILHHRYRVLELNVVNIEGENLFVKGLGMIGRLLTGKRRDS